MSAAVILGGTFAVMLPSGVMSLLQIATIVLCGLFNIHFAHAVAIHSRYGPFVRASELVAFHGPQDE